MYLIVCWAILWLYLVASEPVVRVAEAGPEGLWWAVWRTAAAFEQAGWALQMVLADASFPLQRTQKIPL